MTTTVADAGAPAPSPDATDERRASIAVVDDDSGFAGYLRTFLGIRGYEARSYTRGDEIVAAIRQGDPPDIVLLDVAMPGMSGYDVCRSLRQDPRTQDTPVIFLTAKGLLMDMAEGEDAGSDLYLIKPVLATKLLNMVAMFLSDDSPLAKRRRTPKA